MSVVNLKVPTARKDVTAPTSCVQNDLIYDVGFNNGDDTAFYLSQGFRVVAIDANPNMVTAGKKRFATAIREGQLTLLNIGISDKTGQAEFWVCPEMPQFSSLLRSSASRRKLRHYSIQIPTTSLDAILEKHGIPHYLKLDIEGAEIACLQSLARLQIHPQYISAESENQRTSGDRSPDEGLNVLRELNNLGYQKFKLVSQRTLCVLSKSSSLHYQLDRLARRTLAHPLLHQRRGIYRLSKHLYFRNRLEKKLQHELPDGCSGIWGEKTPGHWMNFDTAQDTYLYFRDESERAPWDPNYPLWCDWHATA